jgi:hypothetical protein
MNIFGKQKMKMKVFRFLLALVKYIIWGKTVSFETYSFRVSKCNTCPHRVGKTCGKCGCYLIKKAQWETESCPLKKW